MSFAVFGASPSEANKLAQKRMKGVRELLRSTCAERVKSWKEDRVLTALDQCLLDIVKHGSISQTNYDAAIAELTDHYLEKMSPRQISPIYGAPERCSEFIKLAKRFGAQRMQMKQRVREASTTKHGKFTTKWNELPMARQ